MLVVAVALTHNFAGLCRLAEHACVAFTFESVYIWLQRLLD